MKKPRIIPAYLNRLTYDERMYVRWTTLLGLILGAYFVWFFAVSIPGFTESKTFYDQHAWKIYGMFAFLAALVIIYLKTSKYRKLIKLEPKVKQTKPNDTSSKEETK